MSFDLGYTGTFAVGVLFGTLMVLQNKQLGVILMIIIWLAWMFQAFLLPDNKKTRLSSFDRIMLKLIGNDHHLREKYLRVMNGK